MNTTRGGVSPLARLMLAYGADQAVVSMIYVVLAWFAATQGSVLGAVGILGVVSITKIVVLIAAGGAVADRFGRSAVLVKTIDVRLVLLGLLALAAEYGSPSVVVVWAAVYGVVDGFHEPTFQALSVDVASRDHQTSTQGWMDTLKRASTIGGYPLAGVVIASTGATLWTIAVAGLLLVVCRVLLPRVEGPSKAPATTSGLSLIAMVIKDTLRGWGQLWRLPELRTKLSLFTLANLALTPPIVAGIPLLAVERGWTSWQFGLVTASYWLGALVGGILMGKWGDNFENKVAVALVTLLPTALGTALFGWVAGPWFVASVILLITGLFSGMGPTLLTASMKTSAPESVVGQIMSARSLAILGAAPLGYAILGAAPSLMSVDVAVVVLGLGLALTVALLLALRPASLLSTQSV